MSLAATQGQLDVSQDKWFGSLDAFNSVHAGNKDLGDVVEIKVGDFSLPLQTILATSQSFLPKATYQQLGSLSKALEILQIKYSSNQELQTLKASVLAKTSQINPEKYVDNGPVRLWTQSFGNPNNPTLLLSIGAGTSGIFWPKAFCVALAQAGFHVVIYDPRGVGKSTHVDYKAAPYNLTHMKGDILVILEAYGIKQAHIAGFSMGGCIAAMLGAENADKILSITLIASTSDLGCLSGPSTLPAPSAEVVTWIMKVHAATKQNTTFEEQVELQLEGWKILNGEKKEFPVEFYRELVVESLKRGQNPNALVDHGEAQKNSIQLVKDALPMVKVPALIIQGEVDPGFNEKHGFALRASIPTAKSLVVISGMGHAIPPHAFDQLVGLLVKHTKIQ